MQPNLERIAVTLWFDPVCPWCWVAYEWLVEVARSRPIDITLRQMSLAMLNEDKPDVPEHYKAPNARSLRLARVITAVDDRADSAAVEKAYETMGRSLHRNHDRDYDDIIERSLLAAGAPCSLAEAADDRSFDDDLRQRTSDFVSAAGADVGTPVISIDGHTFFGPVISQAPTGDEAGELFDSLQVLASNPHFFEFKRPRTEDPLS